METPRKQTRNDTTKRLDTHRYCNTKRPTNRSDFLDQARRGSPLNTIAPTMKHVRPATMRACAQKCEQLMAASLGLTRRGLISSDDTAIAILALPCLALPTN